MNVTITPTRLRGTVDVPSSKSQAHRLLICAALADKPTKLRCAAVSQDIDATADCLRALGAEITRTGEHYHVTPIWAPRENAALYCRESGSTLRFLLPVAAALGAGATFHLEGRLPERPLSPLWEELEAHGVRLSRPRPDQIRVEGRLTGDRFTLAANVSSQFLSGLLFALPLLGGGELALTGTLESAGYLNMTIDALRQFGVDAQLSESVLRVRPGRYTTPGACAVEGDWSAAAFWFCAAAMGSDIVCRGLDEHTSQGDSAVLGAIKAIRTGNAHILARDIPDLIPVLAALAASMPGQTVFTDAQRLRLKESDRIESTVSMLRSLGVTAKETADGLRVLGGALTGGTVDSFNDHRIAMAAAVAATAADGPVTILNAQCVQKSYPAFWEHYQQLGGRIEVTV